MRLMDNIFSDINGILVQTKLLSLFPLIVAIYVEIDVPILMD
jgi:hypothetical protein